MTLRPGSISLRLALWFALVSALVLGGIGVVLVSALEREIAWRDDIALVGRVDRMLALVDDSASIEALRERPQLYANMLGNRDNVLWVIDASGVPLIEINPAGVPRPALARAARISLADAARGQATRLAWIDVERGGRRLTLVAGKMLAEREQMLAAYRMTLAGALVLGAALTFALGWVISRRSLRPVRELAERAAAIDVRSLNERLGTAGSAPQELRGLSVALDQMLVRLADGFAQLSRFSEDLAHEMRTPLNNLMGHTEHALRKARPVAEYEDLLASNQEEYERLARMIDSMLFLARSEHAGTVIERETIDLAGMAEQLADYFEGMAEERGMRFAVHADGQLHADRALVRRAMANLVANALRYGAPGGAITITTSTEAGGLAIAVHNPGEPIGAEHLPHLFERFYRCDPARSKPGDSGGLGLAIVRSIMQLHGGSAEVRSDASGTTFTLFFPTAT